MMSRRILRVLSGGKSGWSRRHFLLTVEDVVWAMGSFCALNRIPFDPEMLVRQYPPPYSSDTIVHSARSLGFRIRRIDGDSSVPARLHLPCLVLLDEAQAKDNDSTGVSCHPAIVARIDEKVVILFEVGTNTPKEITLSEFATRYAGTCFQLAPESKGISDPDGATSNNSRFGFGWFVPELMKYRRIWRDVLIASLAIQLLALGTPLFTQVIIDKVVVHHTRSTLIVLGIGLAVFIVFSSLLSWIRQYLVLHTGNRVDAVLGAAVFDHLFKLPPRYFEHRPTGVVTARLHGVETIREFIASAAVTLILDFPFLLIFLFIMLYYSVILTAVAVTMVSAIAILSLFMAPIFRDRLNDQFLLSARNQAFATEYVSGMETVKSLQMEPQIRERYGSYLAEYLQKGFSVRQIGNTYGVLSNGLEQVMSLLILVVGAYIVMKDSDFTVGMLIAFQMFAGRLSQPMLRIVGLWQQFQEASLAVQRMGDIMNAPAEPYSVVPNRIREGGGRIEIEGLSFRYGENLPYLYSDFDLSVPAGKVVAIMGPSGSGKSTLTKLLLGFYQPSGGTIRMDGNDIRHFSANELRNYFGVVPQETVLFSGTIYDNLLMANPHAGFEQIVHACRLAEIHHTIEALPRGYQTEIGERGAGLSGGQKQRIAIARALLRQPKILVFDEATSSLDSATAEHFAATVNQLKGRATILFITHALPRNLAVDEIVRIGQGALNAVAEAGYRDLN